MSVMYIQDIDIDNYDWQINIAYNVSPGNIDKVERLLKEIDCPNYCITRALENITDNVYNVGFTYSNINKRHSVVCISIVSSTGEFVRTVYHEIFHLVCHIAKANNFIFNEEQCAYLAGDIAKSIIDDFLIVNNFLT